MEDRWVLDHQETSLVGIRPTAWQELLRVSLRLATRQSGISTTPRSRRGGMACQVAQGGAEARSEARPSRALDGWARGPLLPREARWLARHAHTNHLRYTVPGLAEGARLRRKRI